MKNTIYTILIFFIIGASLFSCEEAEVFLFDNKNMLYIPNGDKENIKFIPFYHNPGKEQIEVELIIKVIGKVLVTDKEYILEVVDSLTTANKEDYLLDKFVLRKGLFQDKIIVKINKTAHLSQKTVNLALRLKPNENFDVAYKSRDLIEISFNNLVSKPEWWNNEVELIYLGVYSKKKYEYLFIATGISNIENLEPTKIREICLIFKDYIIKNGITEEDGSPMIIPIY